MKSGVFWAPSWRVVAVKALPLPKLWLSAQTENSHEQLLSPPGLLEGVDIMIIERQNWEIQRIYR